ncbi:hypothetical protein P0D73_45075 [Paraburkholderia sp. RL18-101-BIB-B]
MTQPAALTIANARHRGNIHFALDQAIDNFQAELRLAADGVVIVHHIAAAHGANPVRAAFVTVGVASDEIVRVVHRECRLIVSAEQFALIVADDQRDVGCGQFQHVAKIIERGVAPDRLAMQFFGLRGFFVAWTHFGKQLRIVQTAAVRKIERRVIEIGLRPMPPVAAVERKKRRMRRADTEHDLSHLSLPYCAFSGKP